MRKFLGAAAVLAVVASPVFAQTQPTPTKPVPATPPAVTAPSAAAPAVPNTTTATTPTPTAPMATAPGTVLQPNTADTPMKAVPGAPLAGANSFTESQAKARIEANGFTNVSGLRKDEGSIWRGTAMKDGKSVSIALDYQGNIVAN